MYFRSQLNSYGAMSVLVQKSPLILFIFIKIIHAYSLKSQKDKLLFLMQ